jgi:hypothetical protein
LISFWPNNFHKMVQNRLALLSKGSVSVGHRRHPLLGQLGDPPMRIYILAMTGSRCPARRRQPSMTARSSLLRMKNCTPPRSALSSYLHCGTLCRVSPNARRSATVPR